MNDDLKKMRDRVARAHGQLAGVLRLIDAEASCHDIVTQLHAASTALDRAAANAVLCSLYQELDVDHPTLPDTNRAQLEKLLLSLL